MTRADLFQRPPDWNSLMTEPASDFAILPAHAEDTLMTPFITVRDVPR
jgi:hypothetical protein